MPVSKRIEAARKVIKAINTCRTVKQCFYTRKLIENFQRLHDPDRLLPFEKWILNKEERITGSVKHFAL